MTAVEHERWGPNGVAVEQIVRRAQKLTADEVRRLASAWDAWTAPDPADSPFDFGDSDPWQVAGDEWNEAEDAIDAAATAAGRTDQAEEAVKAAEDAVSYAASAWLVVVGPAQANRAVFAASVAAFAVAAADLVGTGEFTADHLDLLLGPWRSVVGDLGEPVCECGA